MVSNQCPIIVPYKFLQCATRWLTEDEARMVLRNAGTALP